MRAAAGIVPVILLWGLPLGASLLAFVSIAFEPSAWSGILQHPQLAKALTLSLWTGTAGLILSLGGAVVIAMGFYGTDLWHRLQAFAAASLAVPHLAFAIGFGFLIMPSGLLTRLFIGGSAPPQWVTTQDPLGLSLIACLVLKETPFFIAMMWSILATGDRALLLRDHWRGAASLGHGEGSIWLRVMLPQILPRLLWPMVIVWVYGATVVDMALVIGPTQPAPLAVIVWADLNHADTSYNARGFAGAMILTFSLASLGVAAYLLLLLAWAKLRRFMSDGPSALKVPRMPAALLAGLLVLIHGLVLILLAAMSFARHWPYPRLAPNGIGLAAWHNLFAGASPIGLSLALALTTSAAALGLAICWFETVRTRFDRFLTIVSVGALGLPAVVIASGQYRLFLDLGLTGTFPGLFLAHFTPVFAYVFLVLQEPYRAFDPRFRAAAHGLNAGAFRFWASVKAPLLKAPLAMAAAIGFAVGMVQFVPAQLIATGRYSTLPMEAVTRASGSDRSLTAAYALALALLPALAFLSAQMLGRPRWGQAWR